MTPKPVEITPEIARAAGNEIAAHEKVAEVLIKEAKAILEVLEKESKTDSGDGGFTMPLAEVMTGPLSFLIEDIIKSIDTSSANLREFGNALVREANDQEDADSRNRSRTEGLYST